MGHDQRSLVLAGCRPGVIGAARQCLLSVHGVNAVVRRSKMPAIAHGTVPFLSVLGVAHFNAEAAEERGGKKRPVRHQDTKGAQRLSENAPECHGLKLRCRPVAAHLFIPPRSSASPALLILTRRPQRNAEEKKEPVHHQDTKGIGKGAQHSSENAPECHGLKLRCRPVAAHLFIPLRSSASSAVEFFQPRGRRGR